MHAEYTDPRDLLRSAGLRVTGPRIAVLDAVTGRPHSDAEAVANVVRTKLGSVSMQAIYDILHAYVRAGLLRRIEPAGSAALYETRIGDNHHHLVCRSCGTVVDIDCAVGNAPCLEPARKHGFVIDEAEVVFWGLCPMCRPTSGANFDNPGTPVPGYGSAEEASL